MSHTLLVQFISVGERSFWYRWPGFRLFQHSCVWWKLDSVQICQPIEDLIGAPNLICASLRPDVKFLLMLGMDVVWTDFKNMHAVSSWLVLLTEEIMVHLFLFFTATSLTQGPISQTFHELMIQILSKYVSHLHELWSNQVTILHMPLSYLDMCKSVTWLYD